MNSLTKSSVTLLFLICSNVSSNLGGAVEKPAIIGRFASFGSPEIYIEKELIDIKAYPINNGSYKADFKASYLLRV